TAPAPHEPFHKPRRKIFETCGFPILGARRQSRLGRQVETREAKSANRILALRLTSPKPRLRASERKFPAVSRAAFPPPPTILCSIRLSRSASLQSRFRTPPST